MPALGNYSFKVQLCISGVDYVVQTIFGLLLAFDFVLSLP